MFSSVLDKLDTWIGRNFLVASFFPFFLFGVANIFMAQFLVPGKVAEFVAFFSGGYFGSINATFGLLAACAILAYMTNPFVRLLTEALKGSYLFWPIRNMLIEEQSRRYSRLVSRRVQLGKAKAEFTDSSIQRIRRRLMDARDLGLASKCVTDKKAIAAATRVVRSVVQKCKRGELVKYSDVELAASQLCVALSVNCSSRSDVVDIGKKKNYVLQLLINTLNCDRDAEKEALKLDLAYRSLIDTIEAAKRNSDIFYTDAVNSEQRQFSSSEIYPTVFGNNYAALSGYFGERFNVDLNFILPVLSIITNGDKSAGDALATAQQQLDFAIRVFLFVIVFTVIWIIIATAEAQSILVVPIIATAGLAAAGLMLEVVQVSFLSFGETIRAVCILKRFDVIRALHLNLPGDWGEEKALWENVNAQLQWGAADATIKYKHEDK